MQKKTLVDKCMISAYFLLSQHGCGLATNGWPRIVQLDRGMSDVFGNRKHLVKDNRKETKVHNTFARTLSPSYWVHVRAVRNIIIGLVGTAALAPSRPSPKTTKNGRPRSICTLTRLCIIIPSHHHKYKKDKMNKTQNW